MLILRLGALPRQPPLTACHLSVPACCRTRALPGMPPRRAGPTAPTARRDKAPEKAALRKVRAPGGLLAVGASVTVVAAAAYQHLGRRPPVDTVPRVEFWSVHYSGQPDEARPDEARTEAAATEVVRRVAAGRRPVVLTGSPVQDWGAIKDGAWSPDRLGCMVKVPPC